MVAIINRSLQILATLLFMIGCSDIVGVAIRPPADDSDAESIDPESTASDEPLISVPISFDDEGWIAPEDNDLGLQGQWFTIMGEGSQITSDYEPDATVYTKGTTTPDPAGTDYIYHFGAKVGFYLCTDKPSADGTFNAYAASECPYVDDLDDKIAGVEFTLKGVLPTTELRLQLSEKDRVDGTYKVITSEGTHTVWMSETKIHYYDPAAGPFNKTALDGILFYVSSTGGPSNFAFRISNVSLLLNH